MYRLYFRGPKGFEKFAVVEASSDDEAVLAAHAQSDGRPMELWSLDRLVRLIDPEDSPEPLP